MENERSRYRIWTPARAFFSWSLRDLPTLTEQDNDEDDNPGVYLSYFAISLSWCAVLTNRLLADVIQGTHRIDSYDLGMAEKRDPDALPPRNNVEVAMNVLYHAARELASGNSVFAIKVRFSGWPLGGDA